MRGAPAGWSSQRAGDRARENSQGCPSQELQGPYGPSVTWRTGEEPGGNHSPREAPLLCTKHQRQGLPVLDQPAGAGGCTS